MRTTKFTLFFIVLIVQVVLLFSSFTSKSNLHCTQYTSLYIATFELEPHIEEKGGAAIYHPPYSIPLRVLCFSLFVTFSISPVFFSYQSFIVNNPVKLKKIALLWGGFVLYIIVSGSFTGERFLFVNIFGLFEVIKSTVFSIVIYKLYKLVENKVVLKNQPNKTI